MSLFDGDSKDALIADLRAQLEGAREVLRRCRPYVEIVYARNPQHQLPGHVLREIDALLSQERS